MRVNKTSNISFTGFYPPAYSSFVQQVAGLNIKPQPTQDEFVKQVVEEPKDPKDTKEPTLDDLDNLP